jgi:hypothetical protein
MKYVIAAASIAFSVTVSDGAWAQTLSVVRDFETGGGLI